MKLFLQDDNFVLSAVYCTIEENNQDGLKKLLDMTTIDVNQTNKHGSSYLNSTIKALLNFSDVSDREISLIKSSYKESPTLNGSPKTLGFSSFVSDLNENKAHKRNNKIIAKVL